MGTRWMIPATLAVGALILLCISLPAYGQGPEEGVAQQGTAALGTAFTYQGRVFNDEGPVEGLCDFRFALYDAATGGDQVGDTLTKSGVVVESGLFSTLLDFGPVFDGAALYLQVEVACPAGSGGYETIEPRQALTPAPNALYSARAPWTGLLGMPAGFADGVDNDTTYSAGAGLVLSDTTFALAPGYRLPQSCNVGEIAEWDGSQWVCAPDDGGGSEHNHDDRYYTKTQLGSSGSAGVHWNNLTNIPSGFADGVDNNTTYSAGTGLTLNGTTFNVASLPIPGYVNRTLDSTGFVGTHSSIIIGTDGLPLISYYDETNGDLKVYHCNTLNCASGTATTLDSAGDVGQYTSITIGSGGFGLISYYDATNGDLKLARCFNVACTSANIVTVDSAGNVGKYTSITTTPAGFGYISYYDETNGDLKVAYCTNLNCDASNKYVVDSGGNVGQYTSVTRDGDGHSWISYYDVTNRDLKVARCHSMSCISGNTTVRTVDGTGGDDVGRFTSITVGNDGYPLVAYAKAYQSTSSLGGVRVARCNPGLCLSSETNNIAVSPVGSTREYQGIAITVGRDGLPIVSYADDTGRLHVSRCLNMVCSSRTTANNIQTSGVEDTSITIGVDSLPVISYGYSTSDDLRFVHCSDLSCQPYMWRR